MPLDLGTGMTLTFNPSLCNGYYISISSYSESITKMTLTLKSFAALTNVSIWFLSVGVKP